MTEDRARQVQRAIALRWMVLEKLSTQDRTQREMGHSVSSDDRHLLFDVIRLMERKKEVLGYTPDPRFGSRSHTFHAIPAVLIPWTEADVADLWADQ